MNKRDEEKLHEHMRLVLFGGAIESINSEIIAVFHPNLKPQTFLSKYTYFPSNLTREVVLMRKILLNRIVVNFYFPVRH